MGKQQRIIEVVNLKYKQYLLDYYDFNSRKENKNNKMSNDLIE
jgi:hypothetical protein